MDATDATTADTVAASGSAVVMCTHLRSVDSVTYTPAVAGTQSSPRMPLPLSSAAAAAPEAPVLLARSAPGPVSVPAA